MYHVPDYTLLPLPLIKMSARRRRKGGVGLGRIASHNPTLYFSYTYFELLALLPFPLKMKVRSQHKDDYQGKEGTLSWHSRVQLHDTSAILAYRYTYTYFSLFALFPFCLLVSVLPVRPSKVPSLGCIALVLRDPVCALGMAAPDAKTAAPKMA